MHKTELQLSLLMDGGERLYNTTLTFNSSNYYKYICNLRIHTNLDIELGKAFVWGLS